MLENLVTHSSPQIIHAPGFAHAKPKLWHDVNRIWPTLSKKSFKVDPRLAIVTWNNAQDSLVEQSLRHNGVDCFVVGREYPEWNNLRKFDLVAEFCTKTTAEYVIGLDSFDVVFFGDPNRCLDRFLGMGLDLVFNAELVFYPKWPFAYYQEAELYQRQVSPGPFCFLNSGAWMGRREFCREFFSICSTIKLWTLYDMTAFPLVKNCDQSAIHGVARRFPGRVGVDHGCQIFQNVAKTTNEVVINIKGMF